MKISEYGNKESKNIIIQPVDEHDLELIESEINYIKNNTNIDFKLIAVLIDDWNNDLSPWPAKAIFGNNDFGDNAKNTLDYVINICKDKESKYYIGGYSLAGLFSLWAAYQTDIFSGVVAASPSIWFPNFIEYMKENKIKTNKLYLSLGDKEEKVRNPIMQKVGDNIKEAYNMLKDEIKCTLEWNQGNHFKDSDIRCAKGFINILK